MQATFIITGILIDDENLKENVMDNSGNMSVYSYNKIDGVKYYYEEIGDRWFSIKNGEKIYTSERYKTISDAAKRYYKEARDFRNRLLNTYKLNDLTTYHAVDKLGNKIAGDNGWRRLQNFYR